MLRAQERVSCEAFLVGKLRNLGRGRRSRKKPIKIAAKVVGRARYAGRHFEELFAESLRMIAELQASAFTRPRVLRKAKSNTVMLR